MKILITGASGYIAQLLIEGFREHDLLLWSRRQIDIDCRHGFYLSEDLCNVEWWRSAIIPDDVDVVIHLAEVVKENIDKESIDLVVASHCLFLMKACARAALVIYPDTAYKYDKKLGANARGYCSVKRRVIKIIKQKTNFASPVIHPIIDSKGALAKLINFQSRIPFLNIFCSFNARLPCLTKLNLICNFKRLIVGKNGINNDWCTMNESISNLMRVKGRRDSRIISAFFKSILYIFLFIPVVRLLLLGREVSCKNSGEVL